MQCGPAFASLFIEFGVVLQQRETSFRIVHGSLGDQLSLLFEVSASRLLEGGQFIDILVLDFVHERVVEVVFQLILLFKDIFIRLPVSVRVLVAYNIGLRVRRLLRSDNGFDGSHFSLHLLPSKFLKL